jgi:hypothetical protein
MMIELSEVSVLTQITSWLFHEYDVQYLTLKSMKGVKVSVYDYGKLKI